VDGETVHTSTVSYKKYTYDTSDFSKLIPFELPELSIKKKRPYTLSSTLEDASHTMLGRLVAKIVMKEATKQTKNMSHDMVEIAKKTMMETPIQMLVLFSAGQVTFDMGEGLVDIMNGKVFKGLKKLKKKTENK
jgi:beta-glucosidase